MTTCRSSDNAKLDSDVMSRDQKVSFYGHVIHRHSMFFLDNDVMQRGQMVSFCDHVIHRHGHVLA